MCSCHNANEAHMWILNVCRERCASPLLLIMFDMLLSAELIRSNTSHFYELLPLSPEMIYEALKFKLRGHCWSCRWCDTNHSFLFLLQPRLRPAMPLFPSQHPFSTCPPLSLLPTSHVCHTLHLCFIVSLYHCPFFCYYYPSLSYFHQSFPSLASVFVN